MDKLSGSIYEYRPFSIEMYSVIFHGYVFFDVALVLDDVTDSSKTRSSLQESTLVYIHLYK